MSKNIVLVGFMGCGKSTLGKKLAKTLNFSFIDSDKEIEFQEQLTVPQIFNKYGQDHFRKLETKFLEGIKNRKEIILSTGGGTPCFNNNMSLLNELGATFYLKLSAQELSKRLEVSPKPRPLIAGKKGKELEAFIADLLKLREQFYLKSQFTVSGKQHHVRDLLEILGKF